MNGFECKVSNRNVFHWIAGALSPFSFFLHPCFPCLCFAGFMIYQIKQDRDLEKRDKPKNPDSHLDIYEFVTAFTVSCIILGMLKFTGVL